MPHWSFTTSRNDRHDRKVNDMIQRVILHCSIQELVRILLLPVYPSRAPIDSHMERDVPHARTAIRARTGELHVLQPEHGVHTARARVLDRDILDRLRHAPHVHMRVKRARRAVLPVGRPGEGVDAAAVERPAGGDRLALSDVV